MSFSDKIKLAIFFLILASLFFIGAVYGETKGNVKYEATEDRVVVSCVDGQNPIMRTIPRPRGGYYAVVFCEGTSK